MREIANELNVELHFAMPRHVGSLGTIERFHDTLTEHLHLLKLSKGVTGEEALTRAVFAYDHSVHSVNGRTPFEVGQLVNEGVRSDILQVKTIRVQEFNSRLADTSREELKLGSTVF